MSPHGAREAEVRVSTQCWNSAWEWHLPACNMKSEWTSGGFSGVLNADVPSESKGESHPLKLLVRQVRLGENDPPPHTHNKNPTVEY